MSVSGPPAAIKTEPEEGPSDVLDYDEARIKLELALLYVDHDIKEEIVVGPTEICHPLPGAGVSPQEVTQQALASECTDYECRRMAGCRLELRDVARELLCARCGQWSLSRAALHTHRRTHHTMATAQAEQIPTQVLPLEGKSPQHMGTNKHPVSSPTGNLQGPTLTDQRDNISTPATLTHQLFICDLCRKPFTDRSLLAKHIHSHTQTDSCHQRVIKLVLKGDIHINSEIKPFICDECGKSFTRMGHLSLHMLLHSEIKPFHCDHCGKSYKTMDCLSQHLHRHNIYGRCGKRFTQMGSLSLHKLIHSEIKLFRCDKCGKNFAQNSTLSNHLLVHSENKPFPCDKCGKSFKRMCELSRHNKIIHSKIKPFSCEICSKSFAVKFVLSQHIMFVHSETKPFSCDKCSTSFARRGDLMRHELCHSGGTKPFSCDKCHKSFTRKNGLTRHELIHSGIKPFSCDMCHKSFARKSYISEHMLLVHK